VVEVLPNATTNPAYAAVIAMITRLVRIIIPEFADVAVIPRRRCFTGHARLASLLSGSAEHAQHILRLFPNKIVILNLVVAKSASIPPVTC
jgi:hypothetical protein